jgi:hypothetical protein
MCHEFLTRRRFGNCEPVAGDHEQETQARFAVSGSAPGSNLGTHAACGAFTADSQTNVVPLVKNATLDRQHFFQM